MTERRPWMTFLLRLLALALAVQAPTSQTRGSMTQR